MDPRPIYDFKVEGPVQAEVFVLFLRDGAIRLTGPCGAAPWLIEIGTDDDPVETVSRLTRSNVGEPTVVHSTSWRRDRDGVILSFVVVIDPVIVGEPKIREMEHAPVARTDLARSHATRAPDEIGTGLVLEHALRHLAWLVNDDAVVKGELGETWTEPLAAYVPEPFRNL